MTGPLDFEGIVHQYYASLYRFALSLTRHETEACDLTQQAFYIWATKGHQLRDASKVKTWLFTTLYREFMETRRKQTRFQHKTIEDADHELPHIDPNMAAVLDGQTIVGMLGEVDEIFQGPVALFYLEDCSYQEIADVLGIPLGTVKSRIARGLGQLQARVEKLARHRNEASKPGT